MFNFYRKSLICLLLLFAWGGDNALMPRMSH